MLRKTLKTMMAPLTAAALLSLVGCFDSGAETSSSSSADEMSLASDALYTLPSALQAADPSVESVEATAALAKSSDVSVEASGALEAYRLVPAYLHIAENAKEQVKQLIVSMAGQDWPDQWEGDNEEGYHIKTLGRDTTLDGETGLRFRSLTMSKEGEKVLFVSYFRNARGQFSGTFVWRSEGADSTRVAVHFNGRNAGVLGERMVVKVERPVGALENADAPTVVRVAAVRKGDRVAVSMISFHPTWEDVNGDGEQFWGEGAKVFGVRAVANTEKDVALIKVAFADTSVGKGELFQKHLLDDGSRLHAAERMREMMSANDTLNRLVWWSLANGKSLNSPAKSVSDGMQFLGFKTEKKPADLTVEDAVQAFVNSKDDILAGSDSELKSLYWAMVLKQPMLLRSGARIVGAGDIPSDFGLADTELSTDDVALPEVSDAFDATETEFPAED